MGIRETIQGHSKMVAAAVVLVAGGALFFSVRNNPMGPQTVPTKVFATVDDGKTVFISDLRELPPFEHDGKTAYRVWMFTTDGGKTKFPGYLERYTPEAKKRAESALSAMKNDPSSRKGPPVGPGDVEVKRPGAGNPWVNSMSPEGSQVTVITAPNGGEVEIVMP